MKAKSKYGKILLAMEQEAKKPPIFYALTQELPIGSMEDVVNSQELTQELNLLTANRRKAAERATLHIQLPDKKSQLQLQGLNQRYEQISKARASLSNKILDNPERTLRVQHLLSFIQAAGALLHFNSIEQQKEFAEKHDFLYFLEEAAEIDQFDKSGEFSINIAGVTIKDIIGNPNLSPELTH